MLFSNEHRIRGIKAVTLDLTEIRTQPRANSDGRTFLQSGSSPAPPWRPQFDPTGFDCVGYTLDAPVPLDRVAQIPPGSATPSTGLTIRDVAVIGVIDADQVRITIRMFNGNALSPRPLSEKVSKICNSVLRAGSDHRGGGGSTVPRFTRLVLAIRSWNKRGLCSVRRLEADRV